MTSSAPSDDAVTPASARLSKHRPEPEIVPQFVLSPSVAERFNARVLDPTTAVLAPGQRTPTSTVYVGHTLVVRGLPGGRAQAGIDALKKVAAALDEPLRVTVSERDIRVAEQLSDSPARRVIDAVWGTRVTLAAASESPAGPPDAWVLLQALRADPTLRDLPVFLEHVLTACGGVWGGVGGVWGGVGGVWGGVGGVWGGVGGVWGGVGQGLAEYGSPGFGGRTPVVWRAADPRAGMPCPTRPPVVALLDTGVGMHPWFANDDGTLKDGIQEEVTCDGEVIGVIPGRATDPEYLGVVTDPVNGMIDREAGHGTFIAGIIRQRCPQAHILAIPVMPADGAAAEQDVLTALGLLLKRHLEGQAAKRVGDLVDVVNLSLGYYDETPDSAVDEAPLRQLLDAFAAAGVAVVAAAGNDATRAKFFPAAMAPKITGPAPMTSVGALNPDSATVALFSNNGPWITTHTVGAGIVSTVPTTLAGAMGRSVEVPRHDPLPRTTADPDDYRSGFAVWSGTSFAAPMIAGDIAAAIATAREGGAADDVDPARDSALVADAVRTAVTAADAAIAAAHGEET